MEWSFSFGITKNQATGRIFVFGIIFDNFGVFCYLTNFLLRNIAFSGTPQRMMGEFKFSGGQLLIDYLKSFHERIYCTTHPSAKNQYAMFERCCLSAREYGIPI